MGSHMELAALPPVRRLRVGVGVIAFLALVASCSAGSSGARQSATRGVSARPSPGALPTPNTSASPRASASIRPAVLPASPAPGKTFYVSIGDSYAAGWQPTAGPVLGATSTNGYAYQLASRAKIGGRHLELVNFGCGGETTASLLHGEGCLQFLLGPGAAPYPGRSQSQAALSFISAHPGEVGLVTVELGANDITHCGTAKDLLGCVRPTMKAADANLRTFLQALRAAAGPGVPIVGLTYPDVMLGRDVLSASASRRTVPLSVTAFKEIINPTLKAAYGAVGATFVDVTAASGAYLPLTQTTKVAPLGTVPVTVAMICELTFYCDRHDIHPRTTGYALMADLIEKVLPKG